MEQMVREALAQYALAVDRVELIRHNENRTYRVDGPQGSFLLRIHQPRAGYSLELLSEPAPAGARVEAELKMLAALADSGVCTVQRPVLTAQGRLTGALQQGTPVSLLSWLPGETMERQSAGPQQMRALGEMVGGLHWALRAWPGAARMPRYRYDGALVDQISQRLECLAAHGELEACYWSALRGALQTIKRRMEHLDAQAGSFGLVHADLSKSNLILWEGRVAPIDFSLSGFAHAAMDLGGLFAVFVEPEEREALLAGYRDRQGWAPEWGDIEAYFALSVVLYIASHAPEPGERDWFGGALSRWCNTIFEPLASGRRVLEFHPRAACGSRMDAR